MIKIIVIEDLAPVQSRLSKIFQQAEDFEMLAMYESAEKALENLSSLVGADILLVDLELPGILGDHVIAIVRQKYPNIRIAVFTVFEEQSRIYELLQLGIKGYIMKETSDELLLAELRVIYLGGATLTERVAQKIIDEFEEEPALYEKKLTRREIEVLNFIGLGLKYKEIAEELEISPHTVRRHIENIYRKLEVNSKIEALSQANRIGIM